MCEQMYRPVWRTFTAYHTPVALRPPSVWIYFYLGRRLLPDVCGYPVSRIASVVVGSEGEMLRLPSILGFSDTDEVEYRNKHLSH